MPRGEVLQRVDARPAIALGDVRVASLGTGRPQENSQARSLHTNCNVSTCECPNAERASGVQVFDIVKPTVTETFSGGALKLGEFKLSSLATKDKGVNNQELSCLGSCSQCKSECVCRLDSVVKQPKTDGLQTMDVMSFRPKADARVGAGRVGSEEQFSGPCSDC